MAIHNLFTEINANLAHLLYTLTEFNTEDSTNINKYKDENISIFNNLHQNLSLSHRFCSLNLEFPRYLENVLLKISGIVTVIHMPINVSNRLSILGLEGSESHECSLENPQFIDIDLYNKTNSHYNQYPTPSKLALTGCRLVCKCYMNLLNVHETRSIQFNHLISTLLMIYNKTCGMILDDIYDLLIYMSNNHTEAFKDPNVSLFREITNKMADDINNYNPAVLKSLECYIGLTSLVYNDTEVRMYELVEALIDRIIIMNNPEIKKKFIEKYNLYLENTPLVCSATMLQTMRLIFSCIDSLEPNIVIASLKCLGDVFKHLVYDTLYYFPDCYARFILIYINFLSNQFKLEDSLSNFEELFFFNNLTTKLVVPCGKRIVPDNNQRYQQMCKKCSGIK
eukprot:XP_763552.1 hypothetical protein [Theileria parva strain Muguga]